MKPCSGLFTYRNVPSEAFPLGIRLIQEGSRICGYNGAKHRTSAFLKMRYAALCSTHLIYCILRRQINRKLLFCRCQLICSSDKARSMPYKSPPVFRDFPPVYLLDCGKGGTLQKKCEKENIFSMTIDLPPVTARTVDRIRLPLTTKE